MVDQPQVSVGQIWREVDPRCERYIRVESTGSHVRGKHRIGIRTVVKTDNGNWFSMPGSRASFADGSRFNGKRGNYAFHAEGKP